MIMPILLLTYIIVRNTWMFQIFGGQLLVMKWDMHMG